MTSVRGNDVQGSSNRVIGSAYPQDKSRTRSAWRVLKNFVISTHLRIAAWTREATIREQTLAKTRDLTVSSRQLRNKLRCWRTTAVVEHLASRRIPIQVFAVMMAAAMLSRRPSCVAATHFRIALPTRLWSKRRIRSVRRFIVKRQESAHHLIGVLTFF